MQVFFLAFVAFLIVATIMAVGVLLGRKPISGSCGGVGAALGEKDYVCDLCGGDEAKCEELSLQNSQRSEGVSSASAGVSADNFYDVGKERR